MRPQVITQSGVGTSSPVILNYRQSDFKVGIAAVVTGTATYTIEHSFDDPANFTDTTDYTTNATWFPHIDTDLVAATTTQEGEFIRPLRAGRINQTVGAGSVTATFLQGQAD